MSRDLEKKLRLGLGEMATVREQMAPIISLPPDAPAGVIERAAACAMPHSFYTEIEKSLKLIAREWDGEMPSSEAWHKELLNQMSKGNAKRPATLSPSLIEALSEFLAFRLKRAIDSGATSPRCQSGGCQDLVNDCYCK